MGSGAVTEVGQGGVALEEVIVEVSVEVSVKVSVEVKAEVNGQDLLLLH